MENSDRTDNTLVWKYGMILFAVVLLTAFLIYMFGSMDQNVTGKASALISEYNVPLNVRQCIEDYEGYICQADANINLPDNNTGIHFVATAQVLITQEGNDLYIVKLTPGFDYGHLVKYRIPDNIKEALTNLTLVASDYMYCTTASSTEYRCYVPTNMAPLGNATLYYAPLFEITMDGNTVKKVLVYV